MRFYTTRTRTGAEYDWPALKSQIVGDLKARLQAEEWFGAAASAGPDRLHHEGRAAAFKDVIDLLENAKVVTELTWRRFIETGELTNTSVTLP